MPCQDVSSRQQRSGRIASQPIRILSPADTLCILPNCTCAAVRKDHQQQWEARNTWSWYDQPPVCLRQSRFIMQPGSQLSCVRMSYQLETSFTFYFINSPPVIQLSFDSKTSFTCAQFNPTSLLLSPRLRLSFQHVVQQPFSYVNFVAPTQVSM